MTILWIWSFAVASGLVIHNNVVQNSSIIPLIHLYMRACIIYIYYIYMCVCMCVCVCVKLRATVAIHMPSQKCKSQFIYQEALGWGSGTHIYHGGASPPQSISRYVYLGGLTGRSSAINPLRANFFRGNMNICLHFMSFLQSDMTQILKILPQVRKGPTYST